MASSGTSAVAAAPPTSTSETVKRLQQLIAAHRLASQLKQTPLSSGLVVQDPETLLQLDPAELSSLVQQLRGRGVSESLLQDLGSLRPSQLASAGTPQQKLSILQSFDQLCGTKTNVASMNVSVTVKPADKTLDDDISRFMEQTVTASKWTCSNNPQMGEIRLTPDATSGLPEKVVQSFNVDSDWQELQKPTSSFGISTLLASVFQDVPGHLADSTFRILGAQTPEQLARATLTDLEDLVAKSTPALLLEKRVKRALGSLPPPLPAGTPPFVLQTMPSGSQLVSAELVSKQERDEAILDPIRMEIAQLLLSFGSTHTQLAQLANEAAFLNRRSKLGNMDEFKNDLETLVRRINKLRDLERNNPLWCQLDVQLQKAERALAGDNATDTAAAIHKMGLLAAMLQAPLPLHRKEQAHAKILVPLTEEDFGVFFEDCRHVFALCEVPAGHAPLGDSRCLQRVNENVLVAVDCPVHMLHSPVFRDSALIMQRAASGLELPKNIHLLTMDARTRRPVGSFVAFVPVSEKRVSDEIVSAPEARGFVAVRRAIVPPAAVINIVDCKGVLHVIQTVRAE
jgi:hypothetical protein